MRQDTSATKVIRAIPPVAIGVTGTGQVGKIIDRKGYRGVEFHISYGAITATAAVFTPVIKEGDVTGTMTSVADSDLTITEAAAGIAAGTPRTSNSNKLITKRIGYLGTKRYVQIAKLSSTATAGTPVAATALLTGPEILPAV